MDWAMFFETVTLTLFATSAVFLVTADIGNGAKIYNGRGWMVFYCWSLTLTSLGLSATLKGPQYYLPASGCLVIGVLLLVVSVYGSRSDYQMELEHQRKQLSV